MNRTLLAPLLLTCVTCWSTSARSEGHERRAWYIGFGVTNGDVGWTAAGRTVSLYRYFQHWGGVQVSHFEVGETFTPYLIGGLDLTTVAGSGIAVVAGAPISGKISVLNLDYALTYFPLSTGPFIRGGVGFSALEAKASSSSGIGMNGLIGAGYAWWMLKRFNLTVGLDCSLQDYGTDSQMWPAISQVVNATLGFDWY